jgi:pimeloyl-ACP methyl ester carboxylesterase
MEEVSFRNSRGVELKGTFRDRGSKGVLLVHGLTGDREEDGQFTEAAEVLNQEGFTVFRFDLSGRGRSGGELLIENAIDDVKSALELMRERGVEKIGLYGYSMGGLISLKVARDEYVEALFLASPVTASFNLPGGRLTNLALRFTGEVPKIEPFQERKVNWISRELSEEFLAVEQEELLSGLEKPVKIVHGDRDLIVDVENSRNAKNYIGNGEVEIVEGMRHSYSSSNIEKVAEKAKTWFNQYM